MQSPPHHNNSIDININNKSSHEKYSGLLSRCWGKIKNREEFLTLYDTCLSFLSEIDESKAQDFGLSSRASLSSVNKILISKMMEMRQKNLMLYLKKIRIVRVYNKT